MTGSTPRASILDGRALGTDRFTIERQLGEGSMGAVYLAYDRERHVRVALKTLRRVDASGIYRFKREFRALADVGHPNLVRLYELFSEGTEWFFTMEYVEGQDLLSYVVGESRGTFDFGPVHSTRQLRGAVGRAPGMQVLFPSPCRDPERLRDVLAQVTEALMAVHDAGKLHRDLKPDNVLVTSNGRAVVLDFGIAFERHQEDDATMEAGVMGTPAYMSPEQSAGLPVSEATDYYSLGVILYELLTGQVPFDGSYRDVLRLKQNVDPPPPSELVDAVPDDLNVLCVRLLSRDAAERPSGEELLAALGRERSGPGAERKGVRNELPPFLGRAGELTALERALAATADGAPVVTMVHGLSGMGKTALVEHFLSEVRSDAQTIVLSGRCYEHERVPFKALDSIVDALSRYLGRLPAAEAAEVMPKDVRALAQLFPVLKRVDAVRTARRRQPLPLDPRALRTLAGRALKEMLARIAMRQPLVVFIDDLHWGDQDSARLLTDLLTGGERPALLLICTYRTPDRERSPCLQPFLSGVQEHGQTDLRDIELTELSDRDAARLAFALLGISPADPEDVAREAKGSPYLVTQLVDHLRVEQENVQRESNTDLSVSLERALNERVETLSASARTVLELVAVSGRPLHENVIAGLATEGLELGEALAELRSHKLVRGVGAPDSRAIGIYHDSIREAVLGLMSKDQVRNWHRRLAIAIENSDTPDLEALTHHVLGAEDYSRAGIYAIRAASQANEALAFDRAADLYAIAVEHHEDDAWRQELLVSWAEALVNAGRSTRAAEVYLRAADNAEGREAAELRRQAGVQLMLSGRWQEGRRALDDALGDLELTLPETQTEIAAENVAGHGALRERGFEFEERPARDIDREELAAIDALEQLAQATLATDPILSARFTIEQLRRALEAGERTRVVVALTAYFINADLPFSTFLGERPIALQLAEQLARDSEDPLVRASIAYARGFNYQNEGLLQPSRMEFAQAEELFANHCRGAAAQVRACRMLHARVQVMLGQLDELTRCDAWIREAEQCEDIMTAARLRLICIHRMLMSDELERAERALQVPDALRGPHADLTELLRVLGEVSVILYRGDSDAAEDLIVDAEQVNEGSPLFTIRLWRSDHLANRARLFLLASAGTDDPERRLAEVERCVDRIESLQLESHVDHARIIRAGLAYRRDDVAAALHQLNAILGDADMGGDSRIIRACARMRKGQLLGGDEGALMVEQAQRELSTRGVKKPDKFARLYAPGFDGVQSLRLVAAT